MVVCDWLGRYSYEWQTLWTNDLAENRNMDYVVSYIYDKEEREAKRDELQHLCLRLMSRQEAEHVVSEASREAGVTIRPLQFFDRSVFTGRHMDTTDYNPHAQPIRQAVNSLHEANVRTELSSLLVDYVPRVGFEFLNDYYENLQMCWNTLVLYVDALAHEYDESERRFKSEPPSIPASYPRPLQEAMRKMRRGGGRGLAGNGLASREYHRTATRLRIAIPDVGDAAGDWRRPRPCGYFRDRQTVVARNRRSLASRAENRPKRSRV